MDEDLRRDERRAATDPAAREALDRARTRAGLPTLAVIACVHSNLEALVAVLADVDRQGISRIVCLGDVTGYGPDPVACLDLVRAWCAVTVLGGHDEALVRGAEAFGLNARLSIEWSRERLRPGPRSSDEERRASESRWTYLSTLPLRHEEGSRLYVHGSPLEPTLDYLLPQDLEHGPTEKYQKVFASFGSLLFVGHSHLPGLITEDQTWHAPATLGSRWTHPGHGKAIVNVGAVGQPRDGDPRAGYVTVSGDTIEWRRVPYDAVATRAKVVRAGLPPVLGERLLRGF